MYQCRSSDCGKRNSEAGDNLPLVPNSRFVIQVTSMQLAKEVSLKELSNFHIGGRARDFVRADNLEELKDSVKTAKDINLPVFILGGGTNILWSDDGFSGVVIQPSFTFMQFDGDYLTAGAGVSMPTLISASVSRGLAGLHWAGGLPGSFGGAVYGNAGCFGGEMKDLTEEVVSLDMNTLEVVRRTGAECNFEYRSSLFKKGKIPEIIIQATVRLSPGDKISLSNSVEDKIRYRKSKHPLEYPNIGSIFKNVKVEGLPQSVVSQHSHVIKVDPFPVIPAAYLIDKAQMKGLAIGGAVVSPKHPNFIVNMNDARSRDVVELMRLVKERVLDEFGIGLEEEVLIVD